MKKSLQLALLVCMAFPYAYTAYLYESSPAATLFTLSGDVWFVGFISLVILAFQYHIYSLNEPAPTARRHWRNACLGAVLLFLGYGWWLAYRVPRVRFIRTEEKELEQAALRFRAIRPVRSVTQYAGRITSIDGKDIPNHPPKTLPEKAFLKEKNIDSLALARLAEVMYNRNIFSIRTGEKRRVEITSRSTGNVYVLMADESEPSESYARPLHNRWYLIPNTD